MSKKILQVKSMHEWGERCRVGLAALVVLFLCGVVLAPGASAQTPTRRLTINQLRGSTWPTVTINFSLRSLDNTPLGDIRAEQFVVEENGIAQQVTELAAGGDEKAPPLSVVLVVDTSGSMRGAPLDGAKSAGVAFIEALGPRDEVALLPFNSQVGPATAFTADKAQVAAALNAQVADGETSLYDALHTAAGLVAGTPADNRRVIVLLTDGRDTGSSQTALTALTAAKNANALVYTISVGGDVDGAVLASLSDPTGGRYIQAASAADLQGIYLELARELTGQFLLTYTSTTHTAKDYESIRVLVRYTAPGGEAVTQELRYRPPPVAIVPPTPAPRPTAATTPVPLPPGLSQAVTRPAPPVVIAPVSDPAPVPGALIGLIAGGLAALAVLLAVGGLVLLTAPSQVRSRMGRYVAPQELDGLPGAPRASFSARVLFPFLDNLGRRLNALTPGSYLDQVQQLLYQAGPPYRLQRSSFLGLQVGLALGVMVLGVLWAILTARDEPLKWALAGGGGLFAGFYIPYFMLTQRVTKRKKLVLRALPAALDFLVIMVEAGTGFDSALGEVSRRWRNTLTDEFALLLIDFQIGKPRRDAWRELTQRTQVPELNSFVAAMLQSEQTGASIGTLLRTQAEQMRIRRRQRAEEEARMAPVKMLIPMGLFIFPCILIVILGPAIPQIMGTLGNLGQ